MKKSVIAAAILCGAFVSQAEAAPGHRCATPNHGTAFAAEAGVRTNARATRTIYLNKNGGTYTVGNFATNSATNQASSGILRNAPPTVTIPPITSAFNWPKVSACVKDHFARFNIRVTETEPASGDFIEAVVGGDGTEIGYPRGQLFGIASADNFCGITERGIAFNFDVTHNDPSIQRKDDELCATIAHEVGHLVTLEHETMSRDVMSYVLIDQSGTKSFNDGNSTCGTSPQDVMTSCTCGGTMTSSGMKLAQFIGLRPIETNPPTVAIKTPGAGQVGSTFEVIATASDDTEVESVVAYIDGAEKGSASTPTGMDYKIMVSGVAEGMHTLKVEAVDTAGNMASKEVAINVVKLATGETCVANDACRGGICAIAEDGNFCTESCQVANDTCPDGFACEDIGGQQVCIEEVDSGCCSASPNVGAAGMLSLLVGLALFAPRRRRSKK